MNLMLMKEVCQWLEDEDRKKLDNRNRNSHHPSSVNKCMRQMYYDWTDTNVSNYRTATDILKMDMGTWMHKMWANYLVGMGFNVKSEVEILAMPDDLKYPIHGFIDNLIEIDGQYYITELKTVFGRGATSIKDSGNPREDDEVQVKVYESFSSVSGSIIDYLARDSFYRTEFRWVLTNKEKDDFKKWLIGKLQKLEALVDAKIEPKRDYQAIVFNGEIVKKKQVKCVIYNTDWQCSYCVYRNHCYRNEIEDMGLFLPEPKEDNCEE